MGEIRFNDIVLSTGEQGQFLQLDDAIHYYDHPVVQSFRGGLPWRMTRLVMALYTSGSAVCRLNLNELKLEAGGMLIARPKDFVELTEVSPDFGVVLVSFSREFAESLNFGDTFSAQLMIRETPYHVLNEEAWKIINLYLYTLKPLLSRDASFTYRLEIARLLTRALVLALSSTNRQAPVQHDVNRQSHLVSQFVTLVSENYRDHREMDFYADRMCLTSKYITTIVKAQSGRSATDWIERYVILDAQALLASSDLTVQQISQTLHFPSQSFFGKYFKRVTGMSPRGYRQAARNYTL